MPPASCHPQLRAPVSHRPDRRVASQWLQCLHVDSKDTVPGSPNGPTPTPRLPPPLGRRVTSVGSRGRFPVHCRGGPLSPAAPHWWEHTRASISCSLCPACSLKMPSSPLPGHLPRPPARRPGPWNPSIPGRAAHRLFPGAVGLPALDTRSLAHSVVLCCLFPGGCEF